MNDMNEEALAELLSKHLDAWLDGQPPVEAVPPEIMPLLTTAQEMIDLAPIPRPEFGAELKEALFKPNNGAGPTGSSFSGFTWLMIAGVIGLALALALLVGGLIVGLSRSTPEPSSSPTEPAQPQTLPSEPLPAATVTRPITEGATPQATATEPSPERQPSPTLTPIVDVLPIITVTLETDEGLSVPPGLVPGGSSGGGGSGGGGSGNGGDHDRGHGNDADGHDEDNPGKDGNDDD
jgi:hypothetical protein